MPDDFFPNTPNDNDDDDTLSASDIFAEIMRQAAEKQSSTQQETNPAVEPEQDGDETEEESALPPVPTYDPYELVEPSAPVEPPTPAKPIIPPKDWELKEKPQPQDALPDEPTLPLVPESLRSDTLRNEKKLAEAMEYQRIQRIKRRRERRRKNTVGAIGGFIRTMFVVFLSAGLVATILTWFTDPQFLNPTVVKGLQDNSPAAALIAEFTSVPTIQPTLVVTPNWLQRIGVVSGHRGPENDPGAVCEDDGLTEAEINFDVAQRVVRNLRERNYSVDLLDEFDPRLDNYQAAALVSIHANTCQDFGEVVSGYLVAKAASRPDGGIDAILAECVAQEYAKLVPLERRFTLTLDMTDYHTFREIHPLTPAAIMELGFMLADRDLLTEQPDLLAQAITNGVICFLEPSEDYPVLTPIDEGSNTLPDNFVPVETLTPQAETQG